MSKYHLHKLRVRYGETDQMGFVYYGNYSLYLEEARTEMLRSRGFSYKALEESGIWMPVVKLEINYKKPAVYDELIAIKTKIEGNIDRKICFSSEVLNEKEVLLCTAKVHLVFLKHPEGKIVTCPSSIRDLLEVYQ